MTEKIDKKNDSLFPFQTYTFRNTTELETMCPNVFDMVLNPEHENELWIGNVNGLVSPTSEYGLAIKLKGYIIAGKKLTFILPENYEAIRPDNGNIGFRKTVLDMIRLGESKGLITIYTYSIEHAKDDINKILKEFEESEMKFDVAIMNPPYDGNLHLKILEKVIPIAKAVVNISPANQFFAAKRLLKEFPMIAKSKVLTKKIENIELIKPEIASKIFNASFAGPLMILTYNQNCKKELNYMDYNVIPHKLRSVFDKTIRKCNDRIIPNLSDEIEKNTKKSYVLPCPEVHGNQGRTDWAEITSSDYNRALKAKQRWDWHLSFDTENERRNCYDAWHTRFHKFIHSLIKADNFNYYGQLPWLSDYTQPWDDKRFCEYFGITGYIDDNHAVPGSEWEIILKTMEQYK